MKMHEILVESADSSSLATALEFLRNRAHNKQLKPVSSVAAIVNMVHNMGDNPMFGPEDLKSAAENDPVIQNLINNIGDDGTVNLTPFGDELDAGEDATDTSTDGGGGKAKDPQKTVAAMAKKAAAKREG